jgi:Putative lumazine-binding
MPVVESAKRIDEDDHGTRLRREGGPVATATDEQLITQVALDYFEGWFDGDVARMDRALHPDLVKRGRGEHQAASLGITTKGRMLELTTEGTGAEDATDRRLEVTIEDVYDGIASATVRSAVYHEYLHLVRTSDGWKIANTLFQLT